MKIRDLDLTISLSLNPFGWDFRYCKYATFGRQICFGPLRILVLW